MDGIGISRGDGKDLKKDKDGKKEGWEEKRILKDWKKKGKKGWKSNRIGRMGITWDERMGSKKDRKNGKQIG